MHGNNKYYMEDALTELQYFVTDTCYPFSRL